MITNALPVDCFDSENQAQLKSRRIAVSVLSVIHIVMLLGALLLAALPSVTALTSLKFATFWFIFFWPVHYMRRLVGMNKKSVIAIAFEYAEIIWFVAIFILVLQVFFPIPHLPAE